jgi:hypothetical protein
VNSPCKVTVGDGSVAGLDGPHGLAEGPDRGGRVEDDFGPVQAVHHPVERVVAAVADVDSNFAVLGLKLFSIIKSYLPYYLYSLSLSLSLCNQQILT